MALPTKVDYPIIAIGDLHGQVTWLDKLVEKLRQLPEWPAARLVFLGDLVDRGESPRALVARVMELLAEKPGSTCVTGNHDMALVGAAGLDGLPPRPYWVRRYWDDYDHYNTFQSYLGRGPAARRFDDWAADLAALNAAMPADHKRFLAELPWVAEAEGHLFLHNGLSADLDCPASVQLHCLNEKLWDRAVVSPRLGTASDRYFTPEYPVWIGADRKLSEQPLAVPGKVQVSGHVRLDGPDANRVRIRIDTSGGVREPLTGCLLRGPTAEPVFVFSND